MNRVGRISAHRRVAAALAAVLAIALLSAVPAAGTGSSSDVREVGELALDWTAFDAARSRSAFAQVPTSRLQGTDRLATAVAIAGRSFPAGADTAYLARADQLADALAGGVLADGPILLTPSCGTLPDVVAAEIARLDPDRVVALGGEGAVCDALLDAAASGRTTERLAGPDRFATAAAIAAAAFPVGAPTAYLASADDSPDAVAGGILTDGPILLVPGDGSSREVVNAAVAALAPDRVVALGGTAVIGDGQLAAAADGLPTERIAGPSRFATATAIARTQFAAAAPTVYLARADVFADAVASGSLTDGPVLLVPSCGELPPETAAYLGEVDTDEVVALGGAAAVCDDLLAAAAALAGGVVPPPPPASPGPAPDPTAGTTLWTTEFATPDGLVGIDVDDLTQDRTAHHPSPFRLTGDAFHVMGGSREFTWTEEGAGEEIDVYTVHIRGLDDRAVSGEFTVGLTNDEGEFVTARNVSTFTPSRDGQRLIGRTTYSSGSFIDVVGRDGRSVFVFSGDSFNDWAWTPDGDLVALAPTTADPEGPQALVRLPREDIDGGAQVDGEVLQMFAGGDELPRDLAVSNGGDQVVYSLQGERRGELYVMPLVADGVPHLVARHTTALYLAGFSPDDSQIAVGIFDFGRPAGPPETSSVIIPNHRGEPILLFEDLARLQTPLFEDSDTLFDVQPIGPFYWTAP